MFEKLVIGVDGREGGRDALALAGQLASADAEMTLVNVRSDPPDEDSLALLGRVAQQSGVSGRLVSVMAHSPGAGLHREAELQGADLIVVGACSLGMLGRVTLGDVTRAALIGAPCAVAIASKGLAACRPQIAKVGVAYDGSSESIAALATARAVALRNGAAVHAMKVVTAAYAGYVAPGLREATEALLGEARAELDALPDVVAHSACGLPGPELVTFSDEVDILITGSRAYGPLRRMLMGSTSAYLERHARCSLLVVPRINAVLGDVGEIDEPITAQAAPTGLAVAVADVPDGAAAAAEASHSAPS